MGFHLPLCPAPPWTIPTIISSFWRESRAGSYLYDLKEEEYSHVSFTQKFKVSHQLKLDSELKFTCEFADNLRGKPKLESEFSQP